MPARLEILPFVATYAPQQPFVLVDGQAMMIVLPGMAALSLARPNLGQLIRDSATGAVVLDVSKIDFVLQDAEWVVRAWPPMLASLGVRKLAIVASDLALATIGPLIEQATMVLVPLGIELRAFSPEYRHTATAWLAPSQQQPIAHVPYRGGPAAEQPAQYMPAQPGERTGEQGSAKLHMPARAHYHAAGWGGFVGFFVGVAAATLAIIAGGSRADVTVAGGGIVGSALAVGAVFAVHYLRNVPAGRLTWDARGLVEWVGEDVMTFIAWPGARYALLEMSLTTRTAGGQNLGTQRGRTLQISDDSGKTITLCDGFRRPPWLENRPAQVAFMNQFLDMVRTPRSPMVVVPDKLGYSRAGRFGFGFVAVLSYAGFVGAAANLAFNNAGSNSDRAISIALLWAGCLLFAIRAIWPLTRITSKRLRMSTLLEVALRGVVFMIFLVESLVLASNTH